MDFFAFNAIKKQGISNNY